MSVPPWIHNVLYRSVPERISILWTKASQCKSKLFRVAWPTRTQTHYFARISILSPSPNSQCSLSLSLSYILTRNPCNVKWNHPQKIQKMPPAEQRLSSLVSSCHDRVWNVDTFRFKKKWGLGWLGFWTDLQTFSVLISQPAVAKGRTRACCGLSWTLLPAARKNTGLYREKAGEHLTRRDVS